MFLSPLTHPCINQRDRANPVGTATDRARRPFARQGSQHHELSVQDFRLGADWAIISGRVVGSRSDLGAFLRLGDFHASTHPPRPENRGTLRPEPNEQPPPWPVASDACLHRIWWLRVAGDPQTRCRAPSRPNSGSDTKGPEQSSSVMYLGMRTVTASGSDKS